MSPGNKNRFFRSHSTPRGKAQTKIQPPPSSLFLPSSSSLSRGSNGPILVKILEHGMHGNMLLHGCDPSTAACVRGPLPEACAGRLRPGRPPPGARLAFYHPLRVPLPGYRGRRGAPGCVTGARYYGRHRATIIGHSKGYITSGWRCPPQGTYERGSEGRF